MFDIIINFEDIYEPVEVAGDISWMTFISELNNAPSVLIKIKISPFDDSLLPSVYNLAFGPVLENGNIDDEAGLSHQHYSKVFSTILLFCFVFSQAHPALIIGLDGSDERRAYLYHRILLKNRIYLEDKFVLIGVEWHMKLLRNNSLELDMEGRPFFKPIPEPFDYERKASNMYNYYMFQLKS
jgi:hypothetical protein